MSEKKNEQQAQNVKDKVLKIERESYVSKKTKKEGFTYFLKGTIRGREIKAKVVPPDKGAFEILDILFNGALECDLKIEHNEMVNPDTGELIKYDLYIVYSYDEESGKTIECKVKPDAYSDKVKFNLILG